jgi:hypothetical protein|tara:strand:- start:18 stop:122 length:105 start_codon:yes stop_codon:yes gene_type:complete
MQHEEFGMNENFMMRTAGEAAMQQDAMLLSSALC